MSVVEFEGFESFVPRSHLLLRHSESLMQISPSAFLPSHTLDELQYPKEQHPEKEHSALKLHD